MAKKRYYDSEMMSSDPRRRMEREDAGMISEDRSAPANLPQNVVYKDWPKNPYAYYGLDDTIGVIDNQIKDDMKHQKRGPYPEKY